MRTLVLLLLLPLCGCAVGSGISAGAVTLAVTKDPALAIGVGVGVGTAVQAIHDASREPPPPPPECVERKKRITYEPIMDGVTAPPMGLQRTEDDCAIPHDANNQPDVAGYAKTRVGTEEDDLTSPKTFEELDGMWKKMEGAQQAQATTYDAAYDYYTCEIKNRKRRGKDKLDCGPAPEDS